MVGWKDGGRDGWTDGERVKMGGWREGFSDGCCQHFLTNYENLHILRN